MSSADTLCISLTNMDRKKKISEVLIRLIAQQWQKVNRQSLLQPAQTEASPHHMSTQPRTTHPNNPHGSLDTPSGLCLLLWKSNRKQFQVFSVSVLAGD